MSGQPGRLAAVISYLRRNALGTGLELVINFGLPYAIFSYAKPSLGDVHALMVSSAPPILWSIVEFIRRRRVDAVSMIALAGIALSLVAYFGGGGVKFLQLRERLVTAIIGLVFIGSAVIGRPLIYYLAMAGMRRRGAHQEAEDMASRSGTPMFKRTMMTMTLVWGFGSVDRGGGGRHLGVLRLDQDLLPDQTDHRLLDRLWAADRSGTWCICARGDPEGATRGEAAVRGATEAAARPASRLWPDRPA